MSYLPSSETQPAQFALLLAELESRLRHSAADSMAKTSSWSVLSHLGVQADLLGGVAGESGETGLIQFTRALSSLVVLGQQEPQRIPSGWRVGLNLLASFLDDLAAGLDAGDSLEQWVEDTRWQRLTSWFGNFQTPLLVMNEMEELLLKWQDSWCDETLDSDQEIELQQCWARLCQFGNALFHPSTPDSGSSLLRWKGFGPGS